MNNDYRDLLIRRSDRGVVRGADRVLEAARQTDYIRGSGRHGHRRPVVVVAALVVVAIGVAGALTVLARGRSTTVHPAATTEMCIVFAHPDVSADAFARLQATVGARPDVQDLIVFDKNRAYDEAARLLPEAPSAGLTPDLLQPSVRFRLREPDQAAVVVSWAQALPDVEAVSCGVPVDEHGFRINSVPTTGAGG
jgi:cell division protein FtsX